MALTHFGLYVCLPWRYTFYFEGLCTDNYHENKMEATVFSSGRKVERNESNLLTQYIDALCDCLKGKGTRKK